MQTNDLPKLKKASAQWVIRGERITLSAEWEVEGVDGLIIGKRRIPELQTERMKLPPAAWRVHARRQEPEMRDRLSGKLISEAVEPACQQAEAIAKQLDGRNFSMLEEAVWAISLEMKNRNHAQG